MVDTTVPTLNKIKNKMLVDNDVKRVDFSQK